jgi:hypothetical protein
MTTLQQEITAFKAAKQAEIATARQTAALRLACHADLRELLSADAESRGDAITKLRRLIERERLKGLRRHWSYDLNRHIALKQALDRLLGQAADAGSVPPAPLTLRRANKKRRPEGRRS